MLDPMSLYGMLAALVVFGIFIGSWWLYAVRDMEARGMISRGDALLLHIDARGSLPREHLGQGLHIPFEELESRAAELGPRGRRIVVCAHQTWKTRRAIRLLHRLGYATRTIQHA